MSEEQQDGPSLADLLLLRELLAEAVKLDEKKRITGVINRLSGTYTFGSALKAYLGEVDRTIRRTIEVDQRLFPGRVYTYTNEEYVYNYATRTLEKLRKADVAFAAGVQAVQPE